MRVASKRNSSKLLSAIATMALAAPLLFAQASAPQSAAAQAKDAAAEVPTFAVVSVKPNSSGDQLVGEQFPKDGYSAADVTLKSLISEAYNVREALVSGGPAWIDSARYDVEARVDGSYIAELRKLSVTERLSMLQPLLADRFKLRTHWETKELPVYALVIAKNGSRLKEARPGDTYPNGIKHSDGGSGAGLMRMSPGVLIGQAIAMTTLANVLTHEHSDLENRNVLDRTGLTGKYDFTLKWMADESPASPGADSAPLPADSGPSLFTALEEQLGLKLEPIKAPLDVLVIDHIERPSPN